MKKYEPITVERYHELGLRIRQLNDEFIHLCVEMGKHYPVQSKLNILLNKVERDLRNLRSEAEDQMFRDYPEQASIRIFYGSWDKAE